MKPLVLLRLAASILVVFFAHSALAQDALDKGPQVGETLPHPIDAPDQTGTMRTFDSLVGENGLILLFVRSVDWCPYCKNQVINWNEARNRATSLGYNVAVISYDSVEKTANFAAKKDIALPLLSDEGSVIIKGFDVLNEEMKPEHWAYGIPHPIIFVIDPLQTITHRFSEEGYKERPDIDSVISALSGS